MGGVVMERRAEAESYGHGRGRGAGNGGSSGFRTPRLRLHSVPFGIPFAGWLALSDMIADANPELGDTMRALAAVYQAALERSLAERFADILGLLQDAGIPAWSLSARLV